nr:immunoglobulin light chain junction region [Macaca mulatta]
CQVYDSSGKMSF